METNGQEIVAAAPAAQPKSRSSDYITASEAVPHLAACLALVRPVSMSEEAAAEWLAVAATELAGYRTGLVIGALSEARKRCNYPSQIIPFVIKDMEDATPWRLGKPLDRIRPPTEREALPPPEIQGLIDNATKALTAR